LRSLMKPDLGRVLGTSASQANTDIDEGLLARHDDKAGQNILTVNNLSKSYGGLKAANDLSFSVRNGELLGIIGPNGAGKTTLFNLLNGFVAPDEGEILFRDNSLLKLKPNRICALGIARTFQVAKPFAHLSILDNVILGAYVHSKDKDEAQQLASAAIKLVGLIDKCDSPASNLTNRELRLMELARALASKPRLILVDEILAGLDPEAMENVLEVLRKVQLLGITIVIIEHSMQAMVQLVDRFIVLDHGALLAEGIPDDIVKDDRVIEAYLGKKWLDRDE